MQKPTRTILALAAGSLVLGSVGAGAAFADDGPKADTPSQELVVLEPENDQSSTYQGEKYTVGKVVSRGPLRIRSKPTTRSEPVGQVKPDHKVAIVCKVRGEWVDGNNLWYLLHVKKEHDGAETDGQQPMNELGASYDEDRNAMDEHDGKDPKDGKDGRDGKDGKDGKQGKQAWITARYVKNLDYVKWCD
ncbi:SH3 domain-containing protein [Streptomyces sp. NBC_01205]|uniref:SH3 domain-containing protein n=1 Tax=Streptomyces sp. NBC_01205 TaxID=2903771 RepID=UPI002E0DF47B|nr:SH3 domain-containing protein [Streptomyces sp. NBC_01205]